MPIAPLLFRRLSERISSTTYESLSLITEFVEVASSTSPPYHHPLAFFHHLNQRRSSKLPKLLIISRLPISIVSNSHHLRRPLHRLPNDVPVQQLRQSCPITNMETGMYKQIVWLLKDGMNLQNQKLLQGSARSILLILGRQGTLKARSLPTLLLCSKVVQD